MNRFNARSTASILALATALGLAGTAHAAVTVTADAVFVDAAAPEGGVHVMAVRPGHEGVDRFVQEDGGVGPCAVHRRAVRRRSP